MGKNSEYYNVLLNDGIRNLLPFSDVLKPEDLRFESLDGKEWFLNIHGLSYRVHFIRNFNEVWGIRTFNDGSEPKPLFILDRITVEQAENLRRLDIEFMDKRGNAFLKLPKLYLFVSGRNMHLEANAPTLAGSPGFSSKLFKIAGVKLIYALLTDPELDVKPSKNLLNSALRELAAIARISLGSSSDIMRELKEQGYAVEENGTLFLVNRKDLFRRWITGFFDYRPKWNTVRLESPSSDWWKKVSLKDTDILWGGETAASILTKGFLSPERTILYTDKMIYDFVLECGLRKVAKGGDVELMAPLPCRHSRFRGDCVHPILVYADLIYSGNDRNREAAERIYDIYLKKIIEPD
jgi:hypothetical protein